jgi:hypothetical protein
MIGVDECVTMKFKKSKNLLSKYCGKKWKDVFLTVCSWWQYIVVGCDVVLMVTSLVSDRRLRYTDRRLRYVMDKGVTM